MHINEDLCNFEYYYQISKSDLKIENFVEQQ